MVLPAVCICSITAIMMTLGAVGIIQDVKRIDDPDVIYGVIIFLFFILLAIGYTFHLCARQHPILKIHNEGIWIRIIGTSVQINPLLGCLFGFVLTALLKAVIMAWHVITLQLFRIRIIRLRWENITDIQNEKGTFIMKEAKFVIAGLYEEEYNDFEEEHSLKYYTISYDTGSFGISLDNVAEAVQYFFHHPDARETLPSWQDDDMLHSNKDFVF